MRHNSTVPTARSFARVLAGLATLVLTSIVWASPARAATPSELESCFLSKINSARASAGAAALTTDGTLTGYGRSHSTEMSGSGDLYHSSAEALTPYLPDDWRSWGENVGYASDSSDCQSLFQGFMDSPGHRHNLLDPAFDIAGIGVIVDGDGYIWTTHVFVDVASNATEPTTTTTSTAVSSTTTTTTAPPPPGPTTTAAASSTTTASVEEGTVTTTTVGTTTSAAGSTSTTVEATTTTDGARASSGGSEPFETGPPPSTTVADSTPEDELLAAPIGPTAAGSCGGPLCGDTVAVAGLLALAGVCGGLIGYWVLHS